MCGVVAELLASSGANCAVELAEALSILQHRGQDACGVVTCGARGRLYQCKMNGMVRDVLDENAIGSLLGSMGIGHVRYPTAGSSAHAEAQPFYVNSPYGICLAHNGNLINTPHLSYFLDHYGHRHVRISLMLVEVVELSDPQINTGSDSELLLNILADSLQKTGKFRIDEDDIFRAIGELMRQCHGAFACVAMLAGFGIIGFRDPHGIRPIGYGRRAAQAAPATPGVPAFDYLLASESAVADALGYSEWTDIGPGEAVIITRNSCHVRSVVPARTFAPDIFEYVYFARPDSILDGVSVYRSRMAMGDALAGEVHRQLAKAKLDIDVVIPVPDTSRVAALQVAQTMGKPYREGFVKNRYIGRTFIMPGQSMRRKNVRRKLNAMALEFAGKNVLLVDDSIVRGTTSREIIQMARDAGANKVIMASCAPPIRFSNVYGIDMPSRRELVAHGRTEEEVAESIGADLVIYQTLPDLIESCRQFNPELDTFDCSVFTGEYITGAVDAAYLDALESVRNDNAKSRSLDAPSDVLAPSSSGVGCSGPMNGADANIGLAPSFAPNVTNHDTDIALSNATREAHNSLQAAVGANGSAHRVNGVASSKSNGR